jgi:predicted nucleotidyltransferase
MAREKEGGFTVIELMLFLGITGALFAALMVGVSSNIIQQQYKDTVSTYANFLQNQYSEVLNTRNERDYNWNCKPDGSVAPSVGVDNGEARGTTPCVLLGRYIQVNEKGKVVHTGSVVGREPSSSSATSDIDVLKSYSPQITNFEVADNSFDINTVLQRPNKEVSTMSALILRSPVSGLIRVFVSEEPFPVKISDMITVENAGRTVKGCVVGETGSIPTMSVAIDSRIAGPSGVAIDQTDEVCNG